VSRTRTRRRAAAGMASRVTSRRQNRRHLTAVWSDQSPTEAVSNNHYRSSSSSNNNNWYYCRGHRSQCHLVYSGDDRNQRPLVTVSIRRQDACWCFTTREAATTQHCRWPSLRPRRADWMSVLSQAPAMIAKYSSYLVKCRTDFITAPFWSTKSDHKSRYRVSASAHCFVLVK